TGTTHRRRLSGPPAAVARPHGGVGRGSSRYAERVSDDLRRGELATAALGVAQAVPERPDAPGTRTAAARARR
ncbi:MAG TPA: hypothetical protein VHH52_08715, partial [Pseudonocardiaceae bacterium]|nr:hypothetical protein [Pseudonocardiaceae bacterium]